MTNQGPHPGVIPVFTGWIKTNGYSGEIIPNSLAVKSAGYSGANPNSRCKPKFQGANLKFKVQTSKNTPVT